MNIGESIKARRISKNMTQKELAEKVCVSREFITQIEIDVRQPSMKVGYFIAKALDCKVEDLIEEKEESTL